jgi:hypothetical protein
VDDVIGSTAIAILDAGVITVTFAAAFLVT